MSKDEYLITDAPLKALTVFAMPMILGSFFQQVYNMADSIIVGQFVGSSALAAVGACAALTNVFICVALGAGVGAGVLVSRYFGAKDYGKMKTIVSTSLLSFLILSIVLGVFGFCFSHSMMSGLQTPADILEDAVLYLRVYFAGFPFLFMYNILSTMFTSIGESKIPLGLLIFSSILNIFMDLWMVAGLDLGVFGAALATLIAQGISAVFSLLIFFARMRRYKSPFHWFDGQELQSMLRLAVPSILQQSTVSIDAGRECFLPDLCIHRQCRFALRFPESRRKENRSSQKRLPRRTDSGSLLCRSCIRGHRDPAHPDLLAVLGQGRNSVGLSGVR